MGFWQTLSSKRKVHFSGLAAMASLTGIAEQNAASTEEMAATLRETFRTVEELSRLAEP